jgi:hypothetical protein
MNHIDSVLDFDGDVHHILGLYHPFDAGINRILGFRVEKQGSQSSEEQINSEHEGINSVQSAGSVQDADPKVTHFEGGESDSAAEFEGGESDIEQGDVEQGNVTNKNEQVRKAGVVGGGTTSNTATTITVKSKQAARSAVKIVKSAIDSFKSKFTDLFARAVAKVSRKNDDPVRLCESARVRWGKAKASPSDSDGRAVLLDIEFPVEHVDTWLQNTGKILVG